MITFSIAYRGFEENLDDFADLLEYNLNLEETAADDLAEECLDVDRQVVLQVSDAAFGRLTSDIILFCDDTDDDEAVEIEVHHQEPDPIVYSIHTVPVQTVSRERFNEAGLIFGDYLGLGL